MSEEKKTFLWWCVYNVPTFRSILVTVRLFYFNAFEQRLSVLVPQIKGTDYHKQQNLLEHFFFLYCKI